MYGKMNNELRRERELAKSKWWLEQCTELEKLDKIGRNDLLYRKVRDLCDNHKKSSEAIYIKDKNGELIKEQGKIKERWAEYVEELYAANEKPSYIDYEREDEINPDDIGPQLLRSEVERAIRQLKTEKQKAQMEYRQK